MPVAPSPPEPPRSRLRKLAADLTVRQWIRIAVIGALAATAVFGGLDSVDTAMTPAEVGEQFDDGALDVTVKRATLVHELKAGDRVLMQADPGTQFLAIVSQLKNDGADNVRLDGEIDLREVSAAVPVGVFRIDDGTRVARLGPGLSDTLAFVWRIPVDALHAGDSATVRVWKKQYQELAVTYGKTWIDSATDYFQLDVPVGGQR